jgi:2-polyprenyl-3-methyl-5-hydroxy-6-metoxy-1,4-benzoquinol methylase
MPELAAKVRARIYERYGGSRPHHTPPAAASDLLSGREQVFRRLFGPHLPANRDAQVLDVGCGYGEFVCFLQRNGFTCASGIDLDGDQVQVGSRLGVQRIRCDDARRVLADVIEYFDFISALDVLEHIPKSEILDFLDQVWGALKPGGRFLCQVPNVAAFHTPLSYMDFSHETPFTASSLKQVLEIANFATVRVYPMGPVAHGTSSCVRALLWKGVTRCVRLVQTIEGGARDPLASIFTSAIFAVADRPALDDGI